MKSAAAIGLHGNLQPAVGSGKLISKIQRHLEQMVADGGGEVGKRVALLAAVVDGIKQRELKIVTAAGWRAGDGQPALVAEGRALGVGGGGLEVKDGKGQAKR